MKPLDFPVLASSWLDKANAFLGTFVYATPVGYELECLTAPTMGATVIFKPTTTVGPVQFKGLIMHDCTPRVVSDCITNVMGKNPYVPIFQFNLSRKHVEDWYLSVTFRMPTNCNSTVKPHGGGRPI